MTDTSLFSLFFNTNQSQLGYLALDVLVTESLSLPSDVTKYPIEDGSGDFSDHITSHNEELKIEGAIASGTTFGMEFGVHCTSKMIDAISQLRRMHKERTVFTIITGLGKYENMAFTDLTVSRSNAPTLGGQWLSISAGLRQIIKVQLKTAELPPDSSTAAGKTGSTEQRVSKAGDSSTAPEGSALFNGSNTLKAKTGINIQGPFQ